MRKDRDRICYELLNKVFRDNAYASIALNDALPSCEEADRPYVTKLFYGVLERNVYYNAVLAQFAKEKPQNAVAVLVKMGYYLLENMRVPPYAAVHNIVALCKQVGKAGASGFVNAALRHFAPPVLPPSGTAEYLSVRYSYPLWLCRRLADDYGYAFTKDMLAYTPTHKTHVRVNTAHISAAAFEEKYCRGRFIQDGVPQAEAVERSPFGYYMPRKQLESIPDSHFTVQSAASIAAVYAYTDGLPPIEEALDLCAAPGGKAVLTALRTGAHVTACDIHPHRVEMIEKYARRCNARVTAMQNDATVFRPEWEEKFDLAVCDAPCSGLGVAGAKPDILYNRSEKDIDELAALQYAILDTAARYVKRGGRLCYSTCTVLVKENADVAQRFLQTHPAFVRCPVATPLTPEKQAEICLFPHVHETDGFYVAVFTKKEEKA